ncbi:hypothetical protein Pmani_020755 [Petrolisthes manimaculis]|uniref:Uncharacterized protein n=1 Tax=Petrolisthes manimaculis TaxID=1843537 RepID=A0AAE1PHR3_9EUCA|nr:hypothetical protein Pmani_020755 [Petrolisthes manimaculis]
MQPAPYLQWSGRTHPAYDRRRDKKISLAVAYSQEYCECIVPPARPPPLVSGLSCIALAAPPACIGCQPPPPASTAQQKVAPALRRRGHLCPLFVTSSRQLLTLGWSLD